MIKTMTTSLDWPAVEVGDELPPIELLMTYAKIAGHVYATRDWFPGHHNPEYAQAQGRKTIFTNTMFFQGFLSRVVLNWSGPKWFEHKRSLRIIESVYPDDLLIGTAVVTGKSEDDKFRKISVDVTGSVDGKAAIKGSITIASPIG